MRSTSYSSHSVDIFNNIEIKRKSFILLLLLVTAIPFLIGPLLRSVYSDSNIAQQFFIVVLLIAGAHQIASMYLYFDRDAKKIINQHKGYFYLGPIIIALSCSVLYFINIQWLEDYFLTAYAMLTIFHYQKQNIGVYSLLAPVIGNGRIQPLERSLIMGGAITGMLVFSWPIENTSFQGTILFDFSDTLGFFSLLLLCFLTLFTLFYIIKNYLWIPRKQRQYFRSILLFSLVIFFWSMFFIENKLTAFFMYASAHGLQYFVFIAYSSINGRDLNQLLKINYKKGILLQWFNFVLFVALTILLAYLWKKLAEATPPASLIFSESDMKKIFFGLSTSLSLIHYWIDSRIWKMRYQDSREFVQSKFHFLF